jgi:DNA-nicking Smr family endonuclease
MSKKQRQAPPSGDFRNTPFKALKGVSVKAGAAAPAPSPPSRPDAAQEDPEELFRRAMSGAKPLHPAGGRAPVRPAAPPVAAAAPDDAPDRQLFLDAMRAAGAASFGEQDADPLDDEHAAGRRSPSSRMKQLRKGTIRIGQELDLHGSLKDEAVRRLEHFIAAAAAQGHQAVLVITGKGLNSPEGPVLQGAVAAWLGGPGRSQVAEFRPAPRDKGGSGAYVVFLRRT